MSLPPKISLPSIVRGDTLTTDMLRWEYEDGAPIDLTQYNIRCDFAVSGKPSIAQLALGSGIEVFPPNKMRIAGVPTVNWEAGTYAFDVQMEHRTTGHIRTCLSGTISLKEDITK